MQKLQPSGRLTYIAAESLPIIFWGLGLNLSNGEHFRDILVALVSFRVTVLVNHPIQASTGAICNPDELGFCGNSL